MKKCLFAVVLALYFCACDESKEQTTQCNNKLECDKEQRNKGGAAGCNNLGVLYGKGVRQDLSTAKFYYGKGCDGSSQMGCDGYRELNQRGVR